MAEQPKSDTYVENLTPEQREEIRQAFSFYDRDGDDKIKTTELGIVIRSLGHGKIKQSSSLNNYQILLLCYFLLFLKLPLKLKSVGMQKRLTPRGLG